MAIATKEDVMRGAIWASNVARTAALAGLHPDAPSYAQGCADERERLRGELERLTAERDAARRETADRLSAPLSASDKARILELIEAVSEIDMERIHALIKQAEYADPQGNTDLVGKLRAYFMWEAKP